MPSAYILAKDKLEQARALMANEVWQDDQIDRVLDIAIARLIDLDRSLIDGNLHCASHAGQRPLDVITWSFRPRR
ncbi:hypothetical protein [Pelagibacterium xiamenense]|uniref:hypothetical protein n=1 Tax=Pelagibacterium xiamenense TaxID=2901140 RepID=UPI001E60D92A|nr:hypothetical protein [Pelagibacterium xiamenense]MCD7059167.1 hypothetical protein [Pelagibacterium xiamenense]